MAILLTGQAPRANFVARTLTGVSMKAAPVCLRSLSWKRGAALGCLLAGLSVQATAENFAATNTNLTSATVFAACVARISIPGTGVTAGTCTDLKIFADPPVAGVQSFHYALQYDPAKYIFDPANSGPTGAFALGSITPVGAGNGSEQIRVVDPNAFVLGSPLPGSSYTAQDVGGVVTLDISFATPVVAEGDNNIFLLDFRFKTPFLDLTNTIVTYNMSGAGQDFTTLASSCITEDARNLCGSDTPTSGLTITYVAGIPEPATSSLLLAGLVAFSYAVRSRRAAGPNVTRRVLN